jgi:hypothetical protein
MQFSIPLRFCSQGVAAGRVLLLHPDSSARSPTYVIREWLHSAPWVASILAFRLHSSFGTASTIILPLHSSSRMTSIPRLNFKSQKESGNSAVCTAFIMRSAIIESVSPRTSRDQQGQDRFSYKGETEALASANSKPQSHRQSVEHLLPTNRLRATRDHLHNNHGCNADPNRDSGAKVL